ncbi:MAG: helix-turn-helix domain-containing protein, partial [Sphingomonadaceae bacterium]|nr:helix-turn-helix domain-containing protein [Sphingomonadaceae bacterium]
MVESKRRSPVQARAAVTVDAILEAGLQLLEADGVAALTTNRIARRAGVSVGTLYQYFDSKADILAALAERRAQAVREEIARTVIER